MKLTKIELNMEAGQQAVSVPRNAKFLHVDISGSGWGQVISVTVASDTPEDVIPVEFIVLHMIRDKRGYANDAATDVPTEELTYIGMTEEDKGYSEYYVFAI